jgi:hypothetical protein
MTLQAHALDGRAPTVQEEIDRKAFEEIERLVLGLQQGKISNAQFGSSMLTLFNAVSGLCSRGVMDVIAETRKLHRGDSPHIQRALLSSPDGKLAFLEWWVGSDIVRMILTRQAGEGNIVTKRFTDSYRPSETAKEYFMSTFKALLDRGFRSI